MVLFHKFFRRRKKSLFLSRKYRYDLLGADHVVENMCLVATSDGVGSLPLGGFSDDDMAKLIGVDPVKEPIIYGLTVGATKD